MAAAGDAVAAAVVAAVVEALRPTSAVRRETCLPGEGETEKKVSTE